MSDIFELAKSIIASNAESMKAGIRLGKAQENRKLELLEEWIIKNKHLFDWTYPNDGGSLLLVKIKELKGGK